MGEVAGSAESSWRLRAHRRLDMSLLQCQFGRGRIGCFGDLGSRRYAENAEHPPGDSLCPAPSHPDCGKCCIGYTAPRASRQEGYSPDKGRPLQSTHMAFEGVTERNVYLCTGNPLPQDMEEIAHCLFNDDFVECFKSASILDIRQVAAAVVVSLLCVLSCGGWWARKTCFAACQPGLCSPELESLLQKSVACKWSGVSLWSTSCGSFTGELAHLRLPRPCAPGTHISLAAPSGMAAELETHNC